jgi:hypothetical protein
MLDTFLIILCLVLGVVCAAGYRYCRDNVKLTYKDQRIPEVRR